MQGENVLMKCFICEKEFEMPEEFHPVIALCSPECEEDLRNFRNSLRLMDEPLQENQSHD